MSQDKTTVQRWAVFSNPRGGLASVVSVHDTRAEADEAMRSEQDYHRFSRGDIHFSVMPVEYQADA